MPENWRDYCKHYGPCLPGRGDLCTAPDDPAYIAEMEARDVTKAER